MEGANPNRKIKKVAGRAANPDAASQHEEEKQSKPKRVTFEEEAPLSVKQKKNENTKSKRQNEIEQYNTMNAEENHEELNFEDDFDDEWEDEEEVYIDKKGKQVPKKMVDEEEEEEGLDADELTKQFGELKFSDAPVIYEDNDKNQKKKNKKTDEVKAFLGTSKNLREDEVLEFDNTAYDLFHRSQTDWPCLSLDILCPDHNQGQLVKPHKVDIKEYPLTVYVVAGTQAPKQNDNAIYYMKWTHLHKTRYDDDSQVLDEEDLDNDAEAALDILPIKHNHSINRIRAMNNSSIVALWDESGSVSIYDGTKHTQVLVEYDEELAELEAEETGKKKEALKAPKDKNNFLLSQFQHSSEGYALTWSPHVLGMFATGSCDRKVHLYKLADANGSSWIMDETPFMVHKESVEDLQFSPSDPNILASCSVDGTIKFIDLRSDSRKKAEATIQVSNVDVNVISWSTASSNLIASGTEDGGVQVWDIRKLSKGRSIADIKFHTDQITSIEFQPYEDSIVTVASADNRISVWDFSVEPDVKNKDANIPDQLMFVHQGLEDVKEVRHHPYMSDLILSTAANGFNIFKPNYEEVADDEEDEM